jgi:proteasome component ECM29
MFTDICPRQEKTLAACVTALTSSPNPTLLSGQALSKHLSVLLSLLVKANSTHAKDVHLTTFTSLHTLFESMSTDITIEAKGKEALEKLLFDPSFEGLPEAMRTKRAETLVVASKIGGCEWISEKVKPEVEGGERSPVVRGVLAKVGK